MFDDRILRTRRRLSTDKAIEGAILTTGAADKLDGFKHAVRERLKAAKLDFSRLADTHTLMVSMASEYGVDVMAPIYAKDFPDPWRAYLFTELRATYITGAGGRAFVGTDNWAMYCPDDVAELAGRYNFIRIDNMLDDTPAGRPHELHLPEPGIEDDAMVIVGELAVLRSTIAPLVLQGATVGYVRGTLVVCPGIGIARAEGPARMAVADIPRA